jgi:site-specific recombinase XerD
MFKDRFSGELLSWYLHSAHKERIDLVANHLVKLNYRPAVVQLHLHEWVRFANHLEEQALPLPPSVHAPEVQRYLQIRLPQGSPSWRRGIRAAIRIFLDMDDDGCFSRRVSAPPRTTNALFQQAVPAHLEFLRKHRGLSARTVGKRNAQLTRFTAYLEQVGVCTWNDLQPADLRAFLVIHLSGQKHATRLSYATALRGFHRWAYLHGLLPRDLSAAVAPVRQHRLVGIPDLLTDDEVSAVLQTPDRGTPLGRRDYVVLLLAARYGMRPGDIRQLSLDHINWRSQQIALPQAKTGRPLLLPLLAEVSDALIAYLQHGRPQTKVRHVFVRHVAPYEPFGPNNNLAAIFRGALRRAGLAQRPGRKGLYLLRHTLASQLLHAGNSIKTIGDVLGHVHLDSTLVYTKVDLTHLATVALSLEELL